MKEIWKDIDGYNGLYSKDGLERIKNANREKSIEASSSPIIQYDLKGNYINEYSSITKAHLLTGINNISAVARGIRETAGGYIWKYK